MATKRQIKDWCETKIGEMQATVDGVLNGNASISTEDLHKTMAKSQILHELLTFIEQPDE